MQHVSLHATCRERDETCVPSRLAGKSSKETALQKAEHLIALGTVYYKTLPFSKDYKSEKRRIT